MTDKKKTFRYTIGELISYKEVHNVDYDNDRDSYDGEYKFSGERHVYENGKFRYVQNIVVYYDGEISIYLSGDMYKRKEIKLNMRNYKKVLQKTNDAIGEYEAQLTEYEE